MTTMGSSSPSFFLLAFIMLTFFLSCHSQADVIGNICKDAKNPKLCNQILRTDPRTNGANITTVAQVMVERSIAASRAMIATANKYENGTSSSQGQTCISAAGDSADLLNQCLSLLKTFNKSKVSDLQTYASTALTDVTNCDEEFGGGESADLATASRRTRELLSLILLIFAKLV